MRTYAAVATSDQPSSPPINTTKSAYERLLHPAPESLTLIAALRLLHPFQVGDVVYLLPVDYVQNWLYWAYAQKCVSESEQTRAREALKQAAIQLHLIPPTEESAFHMPGPMDAAHSLAVQGHPLVLQPTVRLHRGHFRTNNQEDSGLGDDTSSAGSVFSQPTRLKKPPPSSTTNANPFKNINSSSNSPKHKPIPFQRNSSSSNLKLPPTTPANKKNSEVNGRHTSNHLQKKTHNSNNNLSVSMNRAGHPMTHMNGGLSSFMSSDNMNTDEDDAPECLAVPEAFYATLRSVHGVLCQDGYTVTFQPPMERRDNILLHHEVHKTNAPLDRERSKHKSRAESLVPVEFRRKIISQPLLGSRSKFSDMELENLSLMDRLLLEEQIRKQPTVPWPEIHPIKLLYRIQDATLGEDSMDARKVQHSSRQYDGFVLVSQGAGAVEALSAMIRAAAPKSSSQIVRVWSRYYYPWEGRTRRPQNGDVKTDQTEHFSSLELVDFEQMTLQDSKAKKLLTIGEWAERHSASGTERQMDCLIEIRTNMQAEWPRKADELMERVKVGDFVDAQDVAGKWYEARVEQVADESVTVHYFGWASRWNSELKRWPDSTAVLGLASKLFPPAPLWSQSSRWRERIRVGDIIEIRDTSSLVHRPKWYKGEVKQLGKPTDPIRSMEGGADLELYGDNQEPLLLLDRCQQILVEVAQERTEKASSVVANMHSPDDEMSSAGSLLAEPPFLRWVNLYGEEICQMGTHLKVDADGVKSPSILKYELEQGRKPVEIMKSHPSFGGTGFVRESLRGVPPAPGSVGLHNLGNSCFLNSTVQCLNHMEVITQYFLRDIYSTELNRQNPLGSGGNVALSYASLVKKMWSGEYSVLAPRSLKQTVAAFAPQFDNSYQHDSQEFCQFLMDGLHEDLNRVKQKPYVEELEGFGMEDQQAAVESWRKHLLRHDSIFVDHCQGMHRSHLTCPQCGRESIKFDVYSSISLPLASKKDHTAIQLEDCIEMFMEGEQLDERNAWYCPSCRRHVCALKLIAMWSAPDILILHLKRFQFDTCMTSGGMLRSKLDDTVHFPIEGLDLTRFVLGPIDPDAPPIYKLFGVSEHMGPTANSGHYTATVRNSIDGQWYRCNDSHVGRTSGEAAITGGAYVLFYQRERGTCRWAGMEKFMMNREINPYGALDEDQDGFKRVKTKKKRKGTGR